MSNVLYIRYYINNLIKNMLITRPYVIFNKVGVIVTIGVASSCHLC